jgi:hypothetical protein
MCLGLGRLVRSREGEERGELMGRICLPMAFWGVAGSMAFWVIAGFPISMSPSRGGSGPKMDLASSEVGVGGGSSWLSYSSSKSMAGSGSGLLEVGKDVSEVFGRSRVSKDPVIWVAGIACDGRGSLTLGVLELDASAGLDAWDGRDAWVGKEGWDIKDAWDGKGPWEGKGAWGSLDAWEGKGAWGNLDAWENKGAWEDKGARAGLDAWEGKGAWEGPDG